VNLSRRPVSRHTLTAPLTENQQQMVFAGIDLVESAINQIKADDKHPMDDIMGDSAEVWAEFKKQWGERTGEETVKALQFWGRQLAARMTTILRKG
jgi:hypothetical protein